MRKYYTEQTMESIARRVLDAYDERLYRGQPRAIPIEDLIERHGLTLEFQYLRKNGRILGKTVFDTGLEAVYDMELGEYTLFPVKAGTILIVPRCVKKKPAPAACDLPRPTNCPTGSCTRGCTQAPGRARRCSLPSGKPVWRSRRICLGPPCSCPCQWSSGVSTKCGPVGIIRPLFRPCRRCFRYPARPCGSGSPTTICCKIFYCGVLKIENTLEGGTPCNK